MEQAAVSGSLAAGLHSGESSGGAEAGGATVSQTDSQKFENDVLPKMLSGEIMSLRQASVALGRSPSYLSDGGRRKEPPISINERKFQKDHPLFAGMTEEGLGKLQEFIDGIHRQ
ncbi:MAG TPA: hypothetical protein VFP68_20540, partial [Burkholderiaceae bacterium]|nr:hypothetical protein [Burkholderiaceae bacterium]